MVRGRRSVTIYQVAHRAGVSIATVSRALRGSPLVAAATRQLVLAAAEELRFRPSRAGRSLAEGRHAATGIVFPDLSGPYYAEVVLGYEEVVAELGRSVLILTTHGRPDAAEKVLELAGRVDGMVIMGRTVTDDTVSRIADTGLPLVLLARPPVGGLDTLGTDNERSARALTEHLLRHGYRRLIFLGDPDESPDVAGRHAGFRTALHAAGAAGVPAVPRGCGISPLEVAECHIVAQRGGGGGAERAEGLVRCAFDVEAGYAAATRVLGGHLHDRPDALIGANDEVALGALRAAADLGIAVPGELALTGWDDIMAARYAGLTTVRQPMRELGATAARWLDERMSGEPPGPDRPRPDRPRTEELPTRLVIRSSCGDHETGNETVHETDTEVSW